MKKKYIIIIICVAAVVYGNSIRNGFVFDDKFIIQKNPVIRDLGNVSKIFSTTYWPEKKGEPNKGLYRPLTILSYAVNYSIGGLNPIGYRVVNVFSHACNGVLLYFIMLFLLKERKNAELIALAVSLVFIAHPINTEAVSGVVGRADTMATSFMLVAFLLYIMMKPAVSPEVKGGKAVEEGRVNMKYYALSLAFFGLGLLTKEIVITLPGIFVLYDLSFAGKGGFKLSRNIKYYAGYAAVVVFYMMARFSVVGSIGPTAIKQVMQNHNIAVRFFTIAKVFASYFKLLFYPINLYADYNSSFPYALKINEPWVIISMIILLGSLWLFIRAGKRNKLLFFAIGWFLVTIFPVSQIIPIGAIMAERFLYLPGIGFSILLGTVIADITSARKQSVYLIIIAAIVLSFSARTIRRNLDWYSDYTLWTNTVNTLPGVGRAYYDLGTAALKEKKYEETIRAMEKCIELGDSITEYDRKRYALIPETYMHWVWMNLGLAYQHTGYTEKAIRAYKKTMQLKPDYAAVYNNIGNVLLKQGKMDEAIAAFRKCITIDPDTPEGYYNLGICWARKGDDDRALELYKQAVRLRPGYGEVWNAAGVLEYNRGNYDKAEDLFSKAVERGYTAAKQNYDLAVRMKNRK